MKICDKCSITIPTKSSAVHCVKNIYREKEYTICQGCLDLWISLIKKEWVRFIDKENNDIPEDTTTISFKEKDYRREEVK